VFAAVTEEAGQLLPVDHASLVRYEPDHAITTVAGWSRTGNPFPPVGSRWTLDGKNISTLVSLTGRPARIDSHADASGALGAASRDAGIGSAVGTPILVEGRLWGTMNAGSRLEQPLPPDAEARLARFTELLATAIANAESRAALTASRARIVAAADETRRRIERDLHDGTQQLVSLILKLRAARAAVPPQTGERHAQSREPRRPRNHAAHRDPGRKPSGARTVAAVPSPDSSQKWADGRPPPLRSGHVVIGDRLGGQPVELGEFGMELTDLVLPPGR
jgi:GAF domain-containing protein